MKPDKSITLIREHQAKESATSFLHDETKDNRVRKTTDTRKPKLTLNHLSRLNALRKARTLEANRKSKQVQRMYSQGDLTTTVTKSTEHAPEGTTTTIDREYEEILERYHLDQLFLFESTSDLKAQYNQGKTLVLTGLMYDKMTDKEEPVFKSDSELSAAVAALQADVKDEIEEYAGTPVY
ncbi:hypothetical protein ACMAZD_09900 [Vibrio sp. nBUS_14]|uniref:hypothetical protein n=1 Tax=Vibrio sp. nBUS_14 TaxID=3395321 RepID=UPI003EBF206A